MNKSKKSIKKRLSLTLVILLLLAAVALIRTPDTDRDDIPVVFLHGSSGSLHVFEPLIQQIGGGYRFISYDHPGQQLMQTGIGRWLSEYTMPRSMIERSTRAAIYDDDIVTDELVDQFWELMRYPGNRQAFSIRSPLGREPELAYLAKSIQAPTLLVWGDKDAFVLPSAALSFSERIQQSETVLLPDVGHLPMLEAPVETKAAIEQFLDHGLGSSSRP